MALANESSGSAGHSRCCPLAQPKPVSLNESFGEVLAKQLRERGVSQYRLCQLTGLGADTVCRLINDVRGPTEAQALRICLGLALSGAKANRLLEAGDFYPLPDHTPHRPTGKTGWGGQNAGEHLGETSITRAGNGR